MLEINDQPRGSGKTTKVIKMLREDENAVALVPSEILARIAYPFDLKDRVFSARCGTDSADDKITLAGNKKHHTKHDEYHCYNCGAILERDENAVENLIWYGKQALSLH